MTTNPNAIQVGGTHYQNGYQHWDLVADFQLGYFPGQITKYITRHKRKNGRQDVEKAMHFLDKWEEHMLNDKLERRDRFDVAQLMTVALARYYSDNALGAYERVVIVQCCLTRGVACVEMVRRAIQRILDTQYAPKVEVTSLEDAERRFFLPDTGEFTGDAGPGYVNQDR